jgi:hypothetical protein
MKTLKNNDIEQLFKDFVIINNNSEYANRYSKLPLHRNNKNWKWEGKDFPRVIALLEFDRMIQKYNIRSKNLLSFNGLNDPELEYVQYDHHSNFNFGDDKNKHDLHTLDIPLQQYDFAMLNQTLEHLYNPFICLENIHKYLDDSGFIYANLPSLNIAHDTPFHFFTGFTPIGVACMFKTCGFDIIEIGQWGNKDYISILYKTQGWPDYKSLRSYTNDFNNPVITWVLAKKTAPTL